MGSRRLWKRRLYKPSSFASSLRGVIQCFLLYFVLQLKPQSDYVSVTLKVAGQQKQHVMYKVCEGGWSTHSQNKEHEAPSLQCRAVARRRRRRLSRGGEGGVLPTFHLGWACTLCTQSVGSPPCLYIWRGPGGRKRTQTRRFPIPLVLKTAFNTAPAYSVPNSRSHMDTRG